MKRKIVRHTFKKGDRVIKLRDPEKGIAEHNFEGKGTIKSIRWKKTRLIEYKPDNSTGIELLSPNEIIHERRAKKYKPVEVEVDEKEHLLKLYFSGMINGCGSPQSMMESWRTVGATTKFIKEGKKQIRYYEDEGKFIGLGHRPVVGTIDIQRFSGKKADILPEYLKKVLQTEIEEWKKKIKEGEIAFVLVGLNFGRFHVLDGQDKLKAYEQLGAKYIPVIDIDQQVKVGKFSENYYERVKEILSHNPKKKAELEEEIISSYSSHIIGSKKQN